MRPAVWLTPAIMALAACTPEPPPAAGRGLALIVSVDGRAPAPRYSVATLADKDITINAVNTGPGPIALPCDYLTQMAMQNRYTPVGNPQDEWVATAPPLMPGSQPLTRLSPGQSCSVRMGFETDVLAGYLRDAGGRAVDVTISFEILPTGPARPWGGTITSLRATFTP